MSDPGRTTANGREDPAAYRRAAPPGDEPSGTVTDHAALTPARTALSRARGVIQFAAACALISSRLNPRSARSRPMAAAPIAGARVGNHSA